MPFIIRRSDLPDGYALVRFHEAAGNYLMVFCLATGKFVGNRRHYQNQRQAVLAAKRSAWMLKYRAMCA